MTGPPCALNWNGNDCDLTACGTTGFIDVKGTYNSGRRRLCADVKTTEDCQTAKTNWNMCDGTDAWWKSQCELTCGICTPSNGDDGGDDTPPVTPGGDDD